MKKIILLLSSVFIISNNAIANESGGLNGIRGDAQLSSLSASPNEVEWLDLDEDSPSTTIKRTFKDQPPMVPHDIEGYKINLKSNKCMRCHSKDKAEKSGATQVGESHFIDRTGKKHDKLSSGRHFCVQCHVPQTDAKPLVDNAF